MCIYIYIWERVEYMVYCMKWWVAYWYDMWCVYMRKIRMCIDEIMWNGYNEYVGVDACYTLYEDELHVIVNENEYVYVWCILIHVMTLY